MNYVRILVISLCSLFFIVLLWYGKNRSACNPMTDTISYATAPGAGPHFYLVIPTYNNEQWCIRNLESLAGQLYDEWSAIILNDCSTDNTSALIKEYIAQHGLENRIVVIDNKERCGACRNIYDAIHGSDDLSCHQIVACPDSHVVVLYDGDDWFFSPHALARVAHEYTDPHVWLTYGQYAVYPGYRRGHCTAYPESIIKQRAFRSFRPGAWLASHLRTFKAGLFKQIRKDDLMIQGKFLPVTWDVAMMSSMLELCTPINSSPTDAHFRFIGDILYVYNTETPLNDYKQHFELQQKLDRYLRAQPVYAALKEPAW